MPDNGLSTVGSKREKDLQWGASQSSQSLNLILCSVNSLSITHLTAHTIWYGYIITICAHFRASYSA